MISPNLINKVSKVKHCFTNASDHATISIEISTDIDKQGQGIFRAPPSIQNDCNYVKLAEDVILESQLKCKKDVKLANNYRNLTKTRKDKESKVEILNTFKYTFSKIYGINAYLDEINKAKEDLAITVSLEPTAEEINSMESSCEKKSTELEMILMELKQLTTKYSKNLKSKRDKKIKEVNSQLNKANNEDRHNDVIIIQERIKVLEEEILLEDWKK